MHLPNKCRRTSAGDMKGPENLKDLHGENLHNMHIVFTAVRLLYVWDM
jgi:hypothetical protein